MKVVTDAEAAELMKRKIQPIIIRDTPEWDLILNQMARIYVEVEQRKEAANQQKPAAG